MSHYLLLYSKSDIFSSSMLLFLLHIILPFLLHILLPSPSPALFHHLLLVLHLFSRHLIFFSSSTYIYSFILPFPSHRFPSIPPVLLSLPAPLLPPTSNRFALYHHLLLLLFVLFSSSSTNFLLYNETKPSPRHCLSCFVGFSCSSTSL